MEEIITELREQLFWRRTDAITLTRQQAVELYCHLTKHSGRQKDDPSDMLLLRTGGPHGTKVRDNE
jgi:hypothetical protein